MVNFYQIGLINDGKSVSLDKYLILPLRWIINQIWLDNVEWNGDVVTLTNEGSMTDSIVAGLYYDTVMMEKRGQRPEDIAPVLACYDFSQKRWFGLNVENESDTIVITRNHRQITTFSGLSGMKIVRGGVEPEFDGIADEAYNHEVFTAFQRKLPFRLKSFKTEVPGFDLI